MGLRRSTRLAKELASNPHARLGDRHLSLHVLRKLCIQVDEKTTNGDSDALRVAALSVRLARRLLRFERWNRRPTESLELAMSFSRLSAALRVLNRLDHADVALEIAFNVAPPELSGDLHRRRAWLRMYQLRMPDAMQDALQAERLSSGQEHALALGALGGALLYTGKNAAAIERFTACLEELDPNNARCYDGMLGSYLFALAKGTDTDAWKALELCTRLRSRLKDRHKMQRAKLWWTEGLLEDRLGDPKAAWWSLDVARRSLIAMKAAPEVAAIVAEMAKISPEPLAVRHICMEAAAVIRAPHPLAEPLETLARAARDLIPEAASALRQAANLITPCPSLSPWRYAS